MTAVGVDPVTLRQARRTTRQVARTFSLAARLLPRDLRDDVFLLYLVLRGLDDLVDERRPEAGERVAAVRHWCGQDKPAGTGGEHDGPAARATTEVTILTDLARRHQIPRRVVADFCDGMAGDIAGERPASEEELDLYCYRVAGTVGVLMASVLGVRDPEQALPAARALGMAMQRTNIVRDIDEDLAEGRLYLAADTIARFGPPHPGCRGPLLRDQIRRADELYEEGMRGLPLLLRGRRSVTAAAAMYREILRQVEREGLGERTGRAVVPRRRKALLMLRSAAL